MLKVDTVCMETRAQKMQDIANKLDDIASRVAAVNRTLRWNTSINVFVRRNLSLCSDSIASLDGKAAQLSSVLRNAVNQYTTAENKCASQSDNDQTVKDQSNPDEYKNVTFIDYENSRFNQIVGPGGQLKFDYDWIDFIKSFGSAGKIFGIVNSAFNADSWVDWGNIGVSVTKAISSIAKDYNHYTKIGRAIGTSNSTGYFWRNFFGFNKVGNASTASSASARFYNNLHNTTSPYKLSGIFDAFTGKKGVVSSVAAWAGVALSGVSNAFSNMEEQKESGGTMSTGRVIAETVSETVIDTVVAYAGSAVVGAAIAAVTGAVAAPVVVAAATGLAIVGINAGVEALTGKSATEWVSDAVLDTASAVGDAVADGAKAVASWFSKLSFA